MATDEFSGGRTGTGAVEVRGLLSERLLVVLTREMDALEEASKELKPRQAEPGGDGGGAAPGVVSAGAKGRIEAVGQMTRTLEKLLELKRLEALAARGDGDEDGEAARLRDELLKRLRALDARRRAGPTLFDADGRFAGEAPVPGGACAGDGVGDGGGDGGGVAAV